MDEEAEQSSSTPAGSSPEASAPWWCSPSGIAVGFLLPLFCLICYAIQLNLPGLTARGLSFLTWPYLFLGAGLILMMALGGWLGQQIKIFDRHPAASADIDRMAMVVGGIALMAYLFWFRQYLASPSLLWSILSGASRPSRADELVTGVTSLANGGPVFFSTYAWRSVLRRDKPVPRAMHAMFALLALLTAFRVYAWSERLALIEAVLPLALMFSLQAARSRRPTVRVLVALGPFLAMPVLLFYFGLAESVRSWTSDTYNGKLAFWDFAIGRMASYYYTALNNGAGFLTTQDWPTFRFDYVFSMLHTAPLSVGRIFSELTGSDGPTFESFLVKYADVEFNNPSGLYTVVYDLGIPLAVVYFGVVGIIAGLLFRGYTAGSLWGAVLYPIVFISYLEVFRYPYLGSGRAFACAVCAALLLMLVRLRGHRKSYVVPPPETASAAG